VYVKPKKSLGQHFLKNETVAKQIAESLPIVDTHNVLEIGPGMGMLTKYLAKQPAINLKVVEIDFESVAYLIDNKIVDTDQIVTGDFLTLPITRYFDSSFSVIGNFPYNISTEILFKVLDNKNTIPFLVGMFQREVAQRIASGPGNKNYGITSVLLQAYYSIDYLFTVEENDFYPPPKVKSGVIIMKRNEIATLDCDEKLFVRVVKQSFNQRRKTLRNSLRSMLAEAIIEKEIFNLRPEQLSVQRFVELTNMIQANQLS